MKSGDKLHELCEQLEHVKLVVVDEISMVGAAQFEMIHRPVS